MKSFKSLYEKKMPPGEHVSDMKIKGINVMIHKVKDRYITYVDGDKLDSYKSQREAERMAQEFIKQLKG